MLHSLATIWTAADTKLLDERGALLETGALFGTIELRRHLEGQVHFVSIHPDPSYSRSFLSREAAEYYALAIFNELIAIEKH